MQIGSILNVLMSAPVGANALLPGVAGADAAQAGANGQLGGNIDPNASGQFASLLGANGLPVDAKGLNKQAISAEIETNTPIGDVAQLPQNGNIAIPSMPVYIDQQPAEKVVLTKDNVIDDANGKQKIWENYDNSIKSAKTAAQPTPAAPAANTAVLANEVASAEPATGLEPQEKYNIKKDEKAGKISIANVDMKPASDVDQNEFAAAVARLNLNKDKVAKTDVANAEKAVDEKAASVDAKTTNTASAEKSDILSLPQHMAAKISAKVTGVKQDKIQTEADIAANQLANKLQDLDAQLRTKSFASVKSAHEALQQSPAEQVQVRITQALASGEMDKIQINLHPAELGAVDVDMSIDKDGKTQIRILADKAETLEALKSSSGDLAKSLADAGIKADANSLQFSLRDSGTQQNNFAFNNNSSNDNRQGQQQAAAQITGNYSRYSQINEQELMLTIGTKGLNILV